MTDQETSPDHDRRCTYFSVQVRLEGFRLIQQSHTALPPGAKEEGRQSETQQVKPQSPRGNTLYKKQTKAAALAHSERMSGRML